MFKTFEIKKIQNEEYLIIYLDMNTEFAKLNHKSKTTINKEINTFIKDNKIKFKGKKIILMAGSLLIGTFLYTSPLLKENNINLNYNYSTNIINTSEQITLKNKTSEKNNLNQDQIQTSLENKEDKKNTQNKASTNKSTSNSPTSSSNKNQTNIKQDTSSNNNLSKEIIKIDTPTTSENNYMITIKRSNGTILTLELEEYIIGVVSAEMPASFHNEALKAGAVAARTYALKAIQDGRTLTDNTSTQSFQDNKELQAKWGSSYNTYYNKIKNAVLDTAGLVMKYNGSLINAYYHSTSNGYTEDSIAVFGEYPYLKSVESPVDLNVSSYLKTIAISYEDISKKLGIPVTNMSLINIEKNNSNRVNKIIIDNNVYGGVEFRTKLGLRSTDFDINLNENNISITTRGYGHGVGMSQYGAHEYAKAGMTYQNILKHYYTGITISKY